MSAESPVYRMRIECPVCRTQNDFEALKVGSYTESGRDSDFRPTGRTWRQSEFQHLDPLYYSIATCTTCYYTRELDGNYKNWAKDKRFTLYRLKALREAHLNALSHTDGPLRLLGQHLDLERYPRQTTIHKLLLGVFDEEITEGGDRLNVARYYLRISWLLRDLGLRQPSAEAQSSQAAHFQARLAQLRSQLEASHSELRRLATEFRAHGFVAADFEAEALNLTQATLALIARWQARPPMPGAETVAGPEVDESFFEFNSHTAFLQQVQSAGLDVPLCERDAQCLALRHYKDYFEHSRAFATPELEVQTAYLIAEIARRVGQAREASSYFNHAIRKGHELIHEYQQDPHRASFLRKLVEMSVEQGKKNRDEQTVEAAA